MFRSSLLIVLILFWKIHSLQFGAGGSTSVLRQANARNIKAAVLVPGFLTGAEEFRTLCAELTEGGLPTVAVPMPNWHWLPCLGGRSVRPMLERIDHTVRWLIANDGDVTKVSPFNYTWYDAYADFTTNPGGILKVGGSDRVEDYPLVVPRGTFILPKDDELPTNTKIALIGHSAGGWISRVYLSDRAYGGKVYEGKKYVHSLITLGTPHGNAPGPAFEGVKWCNQESTTAVRSLVVGGTGFKGTDWGAMTQGSYSFCCPRGSDGTSYDGDGITPIESALAMDGAEELILDDVTHFCWSDVWGSDIVAPELTQDHRDGKPWYGSPGILERWADWII